MNLAISDAVGREKKEKPKQTKHYQLSFKYVLALSTGNAFTPQSITETGTYVLLHIKFGKYLV